MAYVFFKRRPLVETVKPVAVTITGTGNATYCYATINGTKYSAATSGIEVMPGDVITLHVALKRSGQTSSVTIDGETVASVTTYGGTTDYEWTVPEGITSATIALEYASYVGTITVTTS